MKRLQRRLFGGTAAVSLVFALAISAATAATYAVGYHHYEIDRSELGTQHVVSQRTLTVWRAEIWESDFLSEYSPSEVAHFLPALPLLTGPSHEEGVTWRSPPPLPEWRELQAYTIHGGCGLSHSSMWVWAVPAWVLPIAWLTFKVVEARRLKLWRPPLASP